jgi:2-desacetyl-2-hydroxyethyl bacteriochlorophyllide A dehydrogenase
LKEEKLPALSTSEVLVKTAASAISPGTEMLVYRGEAPSSLPADSSIASLSGSLSYPFKYGYAAVGTVEDAHSSSSEWIGRRVFAFNPHESCFVANTNTLIPLPDDVTLDDALFLPNMETAVSLVHDASPLYGEKAVIIGQGIVGLLTLNLLARFPLAACIALDHYPIRLEQALGAGATYALQPSDLGIVHELLNDGNYSGADLILELTGNPDALNIALEIAGFNARIVIGSWYGTKTASLDLGGKFHRSRVSLISSQVSTLAPSLTGRWTKLRRFAATWDAIRAIKPSRYITHRYPLEEASAAYQMLDTQPANAIQVILTHSFENARKLR